jgi:tripartite-type tricarboxylate transporter receptor subunit TctC
LFRSRGISKKAGGIGLKTTGIALRRFLPNLQNVRASINGNVQTLRVCVKCIKAGKIKAIAMTSEKRVPQLPDVPTVAELGFPGFEGSGWGGLIAPTVTKPAIVEKISADVRKLVNDPDFQ